MGQQQSAGGGDFDMKGKFKQDSSKNDERNWPCKDKRGHPDCNKGPDFWEPNLRMKSGRLMNATYAPCRWEEIEKFMEKHGDRPDGRLAHGGWRDYNRPYRRGAQHQEAGTGVPQRPTTGTTQPVSNMQEESLVYGAGETMESSQARQPARCPVTPIPTEQQPEAPAHRWHPGQDDMVYDVPASQPQGMRQPQGMGHPQRAKHHQHTRIPQGMGYSQRTGYPQGTTSYPHDTAYPGEPYTGRHEGGPAHAPFEEEFGEYEDMEDDAAFERGSDQDSGGSWAGSTAAPAVGPPGPRWVANRPENLYRGDESYYPSGVAVSHERRSAPVATSSYNTVQYSKH